MSNLQPAYRRRPQLLPAETLETLRRVAPRSAPVCCLLNHTAYLEDYIKAQHEAVALGESVVWTLPGRERIG